MQLQAGISPIQPDDYAQAVEVWEAPVRATHHFVNEADIQFFRSRVRDALPQFTELTCVRDDSGQVAGFIAVNNRNIDMLFITPTVRGQGAGKRLINHAVDTFEVTTVDVNEQNGQAVGFYLRMGFGVVGRSELDGTGKPYPLLHMRLTSSGCANTQNAPVA